MLMSEIQSGDWDVGLATDGDADRIGAVDANGHFVDPQRIFALVLRYLLEKRGWRGRVVRTVSTTRLVDRLAARHGLEVVETPVGFNHIADEMLRGDVVMGGEESGGMSVQGHIPEGDGILMGLLLLEVMADAGAPLHEIIEDLLNDVGPAQYARVDLKLTRPVAKTAMVNLLLGRAPAKIDGVAVEDIQTTDGVKYYLDDGSWLLIRPSGTEPLLRVYVETPNNERKKALLAFGAEMARLA
jgi:phosphomannomutase